MNAQRLKVGLVGIGGVAEQYRQAYADYPRCQLVAVNDLDAELTRRVAGALGCRAARDFGDLLSDDIDAVVISTPNFLHFEQAEAALNAGKHVLLQKPMTLDAQEAQRLHEIAAASGRQLGMYMNSLDNPVIRDLKRMIDAGAFGRVGGINAKLANGRGMGWKGQKHNFWRGSKKAVGGGSFAMLAYHYINLCQWLLDAPVSRVSAMAANLMCDHIEGDDIMAAVVQFRNDSLGVIESAWCVKGEQLSIHGSEGSANLIGNSVLTIAGQNRFDGEFVRYDGSGKVRVIEGLSAPAMGDMSNPFNQHRQWVDANLDGEPMPVPAIRGVQDMRVLDAAYESVRTGCAVPIHAVW